MWQGEQGGILVSSVQLNDAGNKDFYSFLEIYLSSLMYVLCDTRGFQKEILSISLGKKILTSTDKH